MQAVLSGVRDAIAHLGIVKCQEVTGCARAGQNLGLGLAGPASEIHGAFSSAASADISAFLIGAASRLGLFSSGAIWAVMLAGLYSAAYACLVIGRTKRENAPGNYGYDRFYQALVRNGKLPIAILGKDMGCPISFSGGAEILQECLTSLDAPRIARALDALLRNGIAFEAVARVAEDREIAMHGMPVGRSCAIYFCARKRTEDGPAILDALDSVPIPMWIRKGDRSIAWANRAFLSVRGRQGATENWEGSLATEVFNGGSFVTGRRSIVANDQHYHFQMDLAVLSSGGLIGVATDVADLQSVERRLQRTIEAFAMVVGDSPFAMAIFDGHQKLALHNARFALLWGLPGNWLQGRPSKGEIIDRLRGERKLPEQRDFQQWKRLQLQPSAGAGMKPTELWHLPGGKSLRVATRSFPEGGQLMMFEDISEHLSLEASLNRLSQVQKATIDALEDAVAIFGPDGRLMLHNSSFEALWHLAPAELSGKPHCSEIARLCDARTGHDDIWRVISESINAMVPATAIAIHEIHRENGHLISLTLSRLPDGMTMAVFSDFSDLRRFEAMLEEDRLRARDLNSQLPKTG